MKSMRTEWPAYQAICKHPEFKEEMVGADLKTDRVVFRFAGERSYSSVVFMKTEYIRRIWGRFFEIVDIGVRPHGFQEAVLLKNVGDGRKESL
jgi:hypothetical protein